MLRVAQLSKHFGQRQQPAIVVVLVSTVLATVVVVRNVFSATWANHNVHLRILSLSTSRPTFQSTRTFATLRPVTASVMFCKDENPHRMTDSERDSFVRWQGYRIGHLSFSINLFLGFAVASIAYVVATNDKAQASGEMLRPELIASLFWWVVSAFAGVLATVLRLIDFRYTAKRIRAGRKGYQCTLWLAGHGTWILFGVALFSYCIGAWCFVSGLF
ncbi:hypothetical protein [Azonexus sp.]|uniref:hypothetical protein n=1 Tax=Azonexus sp. TaxID=1872668 RepID=UPI0035B44F3B